MSFVVIPNGCNIPAHHQSDPYAKSNLGVTDEKFLFVCVGNIGIRKNQEQIVRATALIPQEIRQSIFIVFIGGGEVEQLRQSVKTYHLEDCINVCGKLPKSEVEKYYMAADATILASKSEGFGLSIIEGFSYGIPNLTFADLPAVKDLFSPEAMMLCETREDDTLALCMIKMTKHPWNKELILNHSHQFSMEIMAKKYIKTYKDIIHK